MILVRLYLSLTPSPKFQSPVLESLSEVNFLKFQGTKSLKGPQHLLHFAWPIPTKSSLHDLVSPTEMAQQPSPWTKQMPHGHHVSGLCADTLNLQDYSLCALSLNP